MSMLQTLPLLPSPPHKGQIPTLGLGVCASTRCTSSALAALRAGYRHLDTAQIYRNEREVGEAVRQWLSSAPSTASRADVFICSKLWETDLSSGAPADTPTYSRAAALAGVKRSIRALGPSVGNIDLYLLHTPRPGPKARVEAWLGLQDALEAGLVRSIGVSNWAPAHIDALMAAPGITTRPALNQVELHPWNQQRELLRYCASQTPPIVVVAYSPLTQGRRLGDLTIVKLAKKHGRSPAQVVLRWCLQLGVVTIPKSDREERIQENMGCVDWELDDEDMKLIEALDEGDDGRVGEWNPYAWE